MSEISAKPNQQEQMVQGAAWLTIGNFLSRFLGAAYIIPWYAWMGEANAEANALFGMGYEVYALFLLISTVGLNVAVAKQIAKYNTLGKPEVTFYLIRQILMVMFGVGFFFALIMYLGAPLYASLSGAGDDLVRVLRSLTLAVLVYPAMSILRGVFQGYNHLKPYAVSQIAEQLIRVIWMLLTAFFIMQMGSGDYVAAVEQSTFAAVIGMFASIGVLLYFLWRENLLLSIWKAHNASGQIDTWTILKDTVKEAIPFVITGAAVQVFRLIDQITFINSMSWFTSYSNRELKIMFAYLASNPSKLTMILIAVAMAIAGAGIPLLTENFIKEDRKASAKLILTNLQMFCMVMFPAVIGSLVLSVPVYTVFYGASESLAIRLFEVSMVQSIFLALYTILSPMLQALFQNRKAVRYFLYGLTVKVVLQIPCIWLFQAYGPLLSTTIAISVPIVLTYRCMHDLIGFNRKIVQKNAFALLIMALVMGLVTFVANLLLGLVLTPTGKLTSLIYLILVGGLGMAVYGFMTLKFGLLDKLIGEKAERLRQKLAIKRF